MQVVFEVMGTSPTWEMNNSWMVAVRK